MGLKEETELLQAVPLFATVAPSKLKLLAFTSDFLTFAENEVLFEQGNVGDSVFVIVSGDADVLLDTRSGPLTVATLSRHDVIGEIAVLCNMPRTATVRATSELTALRMNKSLFSDMVFEFPQVAVEIMRGIALRLENTTTRLGQAVHGV